MRVGIVGLPRSGKTTVFNAVTGGRADVGAYGGTGESPNIGVAKVPDGRLARLGEIFEPKRVVPAEVSYVDLPGASDSQGATRGISGQNLNHLQGTDVLLLVVRAFDDPTVSHVEGSVDPLRDADTMLLELAVSDIEVLDRRNTRLEQGFKGAKAPERDALESERSLLLRLREELEAGGAVRDAALTQDEARLLEGFQLLTAKRLIVLGNVGEDQLPEAAALKESLAKSSNSFGALSAVICGKLEMELAQMEPDEEREFRESLDAGESGLEQMLRICHLAGDLITFFTGNRNEVRAWTVARGTAALKAAGQVHSDFERGFIRAEVVAYDELAECGSVAEARRRGVLRQEGKSYVVQEADVLNILFSV